MVGFNWVMLGAILSLAGSAPLISGYEWSSALNIAKTEIGNLLQQYFADSCDEWQREEELKELKYRAERKAAAMGILWYETWEDPRIENLETEKDDLEKSNENYMGR